MSSNRGNPLVVFEQVTKRFGSTTAVDSLSLEIFEGEFLSIMGPSGCGKTTTLRMLAGLEEPTLGEIRLDGKRLNEISVSERDTPLVWQSLALFPFLSVLKNVEFGLKMRDIAPAERRRRALDWLERLQISDFADRQISQLSGGQQQRVAIARALANDPEVVLADEPTGNIDSKTGRDIINLLRELNKKGKTIIMITHDHNLAKVADRIELLKDGIIIKQKRSKK